MRDLVINLDPNNPDLERHFEHDYMESVEPPVRQSAKSERKRRNRGEVSFHRDRKTVPHTTVRGKGLIARLREK